MQQQHVAGYAVAEDEGENQEGKLEALQRVDWLWLDR